jgi:tetratricopeptide (TPR) repeat protein
MMPRPVPKYRSAIIAACVVLLLVAAGAVYLRFQSQSGRTAFARRVAELSPGGAPPETIDGLVKAIALYEGEIERITDAATKASIYWKLLASRYIEKGMYGPALSALSSAVAYNPEDATLQYMAGLSAAMLAKVGVEDGDEAKSAAAYFARAEKAYLRSIAIDPKYDRPRYGLGVLYVFELGRPEEAIPHLEIYLQMESKDTDAMFVLARAYYMTRKFQKAIGLYDRVIASTNDANRKAEAEANKAKALGALYE